MWQSGSVSFWFVAPAWLVQLSRSQRLFAHIAGIPAQGMQCFAIRCGADGAVNDKVIEAWDAVRAMKPTKSEEKPVKMGAADDPGTYGLGDLPAFCWGHRTTRNTCVNVLKDVQAEFNFDEIDLAMQKGEYNDLPEVLTPVRPTGLLYEMNVRIFKQDGTGRGKVGTVFV